MLNRADEDCLCSSVRYPALLVGRLKVLEALDAAREWPDGRALTDAEIAVARYTGHGSRCRVGMGELDTSLGLSLQHS